MQFVLLQVPNETASTTIACTSTWLPTDRRRWSTSCRREAAVDGGTWERRWATSPNSWTCSGAARLRRVRSSLTGPRKTAPPWDCCSPHWLVSRDPMWSQLLTAPRRGLLSSDGLSSLHLEMGWTQITTLLPLEATFNIYLYSHDSCLLLNTLKPHVTPLHGRITRREATD